MAERRAPALLWITPPAGPLEPVLAGLRRAPAVPGLAVLLRRPGASARRLLEEGRALGALCGPRGDALLVSARVDLALALGAGVHLPERGLPIEDARRLLGPDALVGASRHDRGGLEAAAATGADYATLSPFGAVPGKGPALGAARWAATRRGVALPVLALGGVDLESAPEAVRAGADGLAFIRAPLAAAETSLPQMRRFLDTESGRGRNEERS